MTNDSSLSLPRAVLFDMDGTLTRPMLDFPRIKSEMGIGIRPILEAMAEMSDDQRRRAQAVLDRHEDEAAACSVLNPGCREVLAWAESRSVPVALITRNSRRSVETVLRTHGLRIEVVVSRDDGRFKPDPAPLHLACGRLGVRTDETWMVGDGQYDVEAGNAAGAKTIWLSHGNERSFAAAPWRVVRDLQELLTLLDDASRR